MSDDTKSPTLPTYDEYKEDEHPLQEASESHEAQTLLTASSRDPSPQPSPPTSPVPLPPQPSAPSRPVATPSAPSPAPVRPATIYGTQWEKKWMPPLLLIIALLFFAMAFASNSRVELTGDLRTFFTIANWSIGVILVFIALGTASDRSNL